MTAADTRLVPPQDLGPRPGNDDLQLTPQPSSGRATVAFDLPGVSVGTAEYAEGPTGVTVVLVPAGARMHIDARGGAVGLISGYEHYAHAVCLAGGSLYGLAAAPGVADELLARQHGEVAFDRLNLVSGAVIYDFTARASAVHPDAALGRAATGWAQPDGFPVGRCGAGRSASVGKIDATRCEYAGQGAAFARLGDVRILTATVVNAVGVVVDRAGTVVRGNPDPATGRRELPAAQYRHQLETGASPRPGAGNTTVSVMVTNARLSEHELTQTARQVHASMHRAIQPFHTDTDGDTLFLLTTDEVDVPDGDSVAIATVAGELMWDAVLEAVR